MVGLIHLPRRPRRFLRPVLLVALLACVFVADTLTDREIAMAVFYVAVILVGIGLLTKRGVTILAVVCVALTLISFVLTPHGSIQAGLANAAISISAIAITTYLGLRLVTAIAAVHESRAQLARIARLMSLGELTASIAHEVNQPLAAVVTSANACRRWLDADPPNVERAERSVERIIADANRASEVVARVRLLASGAAPRRQSISINEVVCEAVQLARGELDRQGVILRLELAPDPPPVWADPVQLQQVIANLVLNAMEAMHGTATEHRILTITSCLEMGSVLVCVADSGSGFSNDAGLRLFDAFWSTKAEGVGIGLTISRSIIEAHGGRIWAVPRTNGAELRFSLPVEAGARTLP